MEYGLIGAGFALLALATAVSDAKTAVIVLLCWIGLNGLVFAKLISRTRVAGVCLQVSSAGSQTKPQHEQNTYSTPHERPLKFRKTGSRKRRPNRTMNR